MIVFNDFTPKEILIWLDGPRTFTLLDKDGNLHLAHWLQEIDESWSYVVVPIDENILKQLYDCKLPLRNVLNQQLIYIVRVSLDIQSISTVSTVSWNDLPQDMLPGVDCFLNRRI